MYQYHVEQQRLHQQQQEQEEKERQERQQRHKQQQQQHLYKSQQPSAAGHDSTNTVTTGPSQWQRSRLTDQAGGGGSSDGRGDNTNRQSIASASSLDYSVMTTPVEPSDYLAGFDQPIPNRYMNVRPSPGRTPDRLEVDLAELKPDRDRPTAYMKLKAMRSSRSMLRYQVVGTTDADPGPDDGFNHGLQLGQDADLGVGFQQPVSEPVPAVGPSAMPPAKERAVSRPAGVKSSPSPAPGMIAESHPGRMFSRNSFRRWARRPAASPSAGARSGLGSIAENHHLMSSSPDLDRMIHQPAIGTWGPDGRFGVPNMATRNAAQETANTTGNIVAVWSEKCEENEPLMDVSVPDIDITRQAKEGEKTTQGAPSDDLNRSYFFPKDPDKPDWKPISLQKPYLAMVVLLSIGLAATQEFLYQKSQQQKRHALGLLTFTYISEISSLQFFTWRYAPTIVTVIYGILWHIPTYEINRLEPYYQLSRRGGATAHHSLNLTYPTDLIFTIPFRAAKNRHWAVVLSNVAFLISSILLPTIQSASLYLSPPPQQRMKLVRKTVNVSAAWSRVTTALFICVALIGIALMVILRRKSGLLSDPKGIAGVAAMATRSHILSDFHGFDTNSNRKIHRSLRRRRYVLHKSSLWQGEMRTAKAKSEPVSRGNEHSQPMLLRKRAAIPFLTAIVLFIGFVPVLAFFIPVSQAVSPYPWLLVGISTLVKMVWNLLDSDLRTLEPFYVLSLRHAPSNVLVLDYTGTIPGWLVVKSVWNRHFMVGAIAFGSVLCELLTVCAPALTGTPGSFHRTDEDAAVQSGDTMESFKSYWASTAITETALTFMFITLVVAMALRSERCMPRKPGSIASVLAFIQASRMLNPDFINTERLTGSQMERHLAVIGKRYGFGWFRSMGEDHLGIDEEELDGNYEYGKQWRGCRLDGDWVDMTVL